MSERKWASLMPDIVLLALAVRKFARNPYPTAQLGHLLTRSQTGSFYYLVRYALNRLDLENDKEQATRRNAAAAILRRLDPQDQDEKGNDDGRRKRRSRKEDLVLNQYEQMVAMDVVAPEDIPVAFDGSLLSCLTSTVEANSLQTLGA